MLEYNSSPPTRYFPTISKKDRVFAKSGAYRAVIQASGDMAQENPMPIRDNINAPPTLTYNRYNFLQSSNKKLLRRDNTQNCHPNVTTLRMALCCPIPRENIMKTDTKRQHVQGNLTLNYTPAAHRKAYQNRSINNRNDHLAYPANSKNDRKG